MHEGGAGPWLRAAIRSHPTFVNPCHRAMTADLKWGAKWGLLCGVMFGCVTAIILALKEELPVGPSPVLIVLSYPAAGVVAGCIVGILRRFLTSRRNSMVLAP